MYKTLVAVMWWWGFCEKDAWAYIATADKQMLENIVAGYEKQAQRTFYND